MVKSWSKSGQVGGSEGMGGWAAGGHLLVQSSGGSGMLHEASEATLGGANSRVCVRVCVSQSYSYLLFSVMRVCVCVCGGPLLNTIREQHRYDSSAQST